jgi:putative acetyltransferase
MSVAYSFPVIIGGKIAVDDPRKPDVRRLLDRHLEFALAQTPPEHSFALDAAGLLDPAITLFSFRADDDLMGIGAIKRLSRHHAEIKSMHIAETARSRGIGTALLAHLLDVARTTGFRRVSLETGTAAAYAPARALYQRAGFILCGPFASYQATEHNLFMTLELDTAA